MMYEAQNGTPHRTRAVPDIQNIHHKGEDEDEEAGVRLGAGLRGSGVGDG